MIKYLFLCVAILFSTNLYASSLEDNYFKYINNHCVGVSDFSNMVMTAKNNGYSKETLIETLIEFESPDISLHNEIMGIIEWAYSIPYIIKPIDFKKEVYDSCMEYYYSYE